MIAAKLFGAVMLLSTVTPLSAQQIRCDMPADVVFLMDASGSIKPGEWQQEKEFVANLIDSLAVGPRAIHVGVIVYSTDIGQVIDLQPFKSRTQLKAMLRGLEQDGQGTDTALAVARMRSMVANQGRPGAIPIAVVITDGRSDDVHKTIQEALNARTVEKITMIALGVGNETYLDELQEIAPKDHNHNRLFTVSDFTQLQNVVQEISDLICKVVPMTSLEPTIPPTTATTVEPSPTTTPYLPPISCQQPADVVFLLDGSHSIQAEDWDRGRIFVSTLINSLEVGDEGIHVGIIVYSSNVGDTIPIKPFLGKAELKRRVSGLRQTPLGRTNTALGLQALRGMFATHGRPGIPHIGIVITDGKSSNVHQTKSEASLAKTASGIVMLVIGVGKRTLQTELEAMASSPSTLFNVSDFSALIDIVETLRDQICEVIVSTIPPPTVSTTPSIPALCRECLEVGGVGYNSYPPDCTKYVTCYPQNGGYKPVVTSCPFGLYWSSEAVACLDALFVDCPSDPCRGQPQGWTHNTGQRGVASTGHVEEGARSPSAASKAIATAKMAAVCRMPAVEMLVLWSGHCRPAVPVNIGLIHTVSTTISS
ncbi:cartilage matrix protein-like isoform X2 [Pomacea canaliculata]|uniref:cartilage matrix protein-like isoform X2 n=1 Tax=Pomacea canaliculata TaxID=400727 RepID=UPI000D72B67C|nr:cartilage matrix protein-like isoform X2 [Pomacea canaliculata]